ncbi:MAG: AMP-binding protein [bacterium]
MNLADNLWTTAENMPDKTGVVFYDRKITFAGLRDTVASVAGGLKKSGIGPGSVVGIAMPNVPEFVISYYAVLSLGGIVLSMNPLYTTYELDYLVSDSNAELIITHPLIEKSPLEVSKAKSIPLLFGDNFGDKSKRTIYDAANDAEPIKEPVETTGDETAAIIYTNAVEGTPLGAQLTHEGLSFDAATSAHTAGITEEDTFLSIIPLYHAFAASANMNLPIIAGATQILHELFNEERAMKSLREEGVTFFPAVPAIFKRLIDKFGDKGIELPNLRGPVPGGAPPPPGMLEKLEKAFSTTVFEGYGITECGPMTAVNPIAKRIRKLGTVGPPLQGITVKIVDDAGDEVPTETDGELCVSGKNVMKGYLNRDEETRRYLRDGWFHTGDIAKVDDEGFVTITGRKKRMIIVGGFNVYPVEVENALRRHPDIDDCEVYGVEDETMGERVAARVVCKSKEAPDKVKIQKFARQYLAPYKIPRIIEFE